ncbi:MAG: endonuclease/exonuclease/phosphatase family protein [Bacteroidota bacterium]
MKIVLRAALIPFFSFLIVSVRAQSSDLINLEFGTLDNFDIATWNLEFFPKEDQTTIDFMVELVEELELDVIAIQEIDDAEAFQDLIDLFQGYDGVYQSDDFLKLGYLYNVQSVEVNEVYNIFEGGNFGNPFPRRPMVMELTFMGEHDFVVINNHFKCCGNGVLNDDDFWDEETRRAYASQLLKDYMDSFHPDDNVIMLGDLNDLLIDNLSNNVFAVFYEDSENYKFADQEIALGPSSQWSFPSWPSHLDHILISNELFSALDDDDSRIETIQIDEFFPGGFDGYEDNVSDHLPVAFGFNPNNLVPLSSSGTNGNNDRATLFPNPSNGKFFVSGLSESKSGVLRVFNQYGQTVEEMIWANGADRVELDLRDQSKGIYIIEFTAGSNDVTYKKAVVR